MSWISQFLSKRGKAAAILKRAIGKSKGNPTAAIVDYTAVIEMQKVPLDLRAMALFNRGLAYSQGQEMVRAMKDFQEVLAMPEVPAQVASAAKERLERLRKRSDRAGPAE